jgi:hypothetical protein
VGWVAAKEVVRHLAKKQGGTQNGTPAGVTVGPSLTAHVLLRLGLKGHLVRSRDLNWNLGGKILMSVYWGTSSAFRS